MTILAQAILKTLAFFDAQELPLTLLEIKAYLPYEVGSGAATLGNLEEILSTELAGFVGHDGGFYYLRGRTRLPELREKRYKTSFSRFRKAKKYLWFLRFLPYLRGVALSGSQALLNSSDDSDIDLLLITKKNRIWLCRVLVSLYFQILGQRRHDNFIRSRFCLNHYLCFGRVIEEDKNLYTAINYAAVLPVLGEQSFAAFWQTNPWLFEFLNAPQFEQTLPFFKFGFGAAQRLMEYILEFTVGPFFNWVSGMYQKNRIKLQDYIIVSDDELSFHPGSRGQQVLAKFRQTLAALGT